MHANTTASKQVCLPSPLSRSPFLSAYPFLGVRSSSSYPISPFAPSQPAILTAPLPFSFPLCGNLSRAHSSLKSLKPFQTIEIERTKQERRKGQGSPSRSIGQTDDPSRVGIDVARTFLARPNERQHGLHVECMLCQINLINFRVRTSLQQRRFPVAAVCPVTERITRAAALNRKHSTVYRDRGRAREGEEGGV